MIIAFAAETILWKRNKLKPLDAVLANAFWRFVAIITVFLVLLIFSDDLFVDLTWEAVGWAFAIQLFGASAIMAWSITLKNMAVSLAQPLSLFRIIPMTLVSFLIFGGGLSFWEIGLVAAIAVFCFSLGYLQGRHETKSVKDGNYKKGLFFLLVWIFCFTSIDLIVMQATRTGVNPITFSAIRSVAFLMASTIIFFSFRKQRAEGLRILFKDRNMIFIGIAFAVSSLLFITILTQMDNVGILSAFVVASVPLVVLYGAIFLRDKIKWYNYVFITLIIGCVVALTIITT